MVATKTLANATMKLRNGADGFSYDANGDQPTAGYAVALSEAPVYRVNDYSKADSDTVARQFYQWLNTHHDALDGKMLGGWYDTDADVYEVEPSQLVSNQEAAEELARKHNQIAVFDLATLTEVATDGTGNR